MPRLSLFISILVLIFCFLAIPTKTFAVEECSGKVKDESNNPIEAVKIDLYQGAVVTPTQTASTTADGAYSFRHNGFGSGALATSKIIFSKDSYQDIIIDYSTGGSCPGDQTLKSITSGGYACNKGTCTFVHTGSEFSDEATCKLDCGIYWFDSSKGLCFPDPKSDHLTEDVYSLKECQAKIPISSGDKYKYNSPTNTCVKDPSGVSFDECQKSIKSSLSSSGIDCSDPKNEDKCSTAAGKFCDAAKKELKTAIGCIPTDPAKLVEALLKFAAGGAGGIALLLMVFGAFRMVTSAGNAESLKAGQEQFSAAVIGLLFIIFAVLLLKIIGVDILNLPGFG